MMPTKDKSNAFSSDLALQTAFSASDAPSFSLEVNQALLKEDDDLLRQIFSQVFKHHHPQLANKVDVIFTLAQVRGIVVCSQKRNKEKFLRCMIGILQYICPTYFIFFFKQEDILDLAEVSFYDENIVQGKD